MIHSAPLADPLRHSYLLEMGVEVYLPISAFTPPAAASIQSPVLAPVKDPSKTPQSARNDASEGATGIPSQTPSIRRFLDPDEGTGSAPRSAPPRQQAAAEASSETLRCFGSVGASMVMLLQTPVVPRAHPLSLEYRRSLGALLEALELNQDRVFLICFNEAVDIELLRTSLPPARRLTLGFAVAERFVKLLGEDLVLLDPQLPPPRAQGAWKRRIWPALRQVRKRLGLRVGP